MARVQVYLFIFLFLTSTTEAHLLLYGFENHFKNRGLYDFSLTSKYFSTSKNLDATGGSFTPNGLSLLSRVEESLVFRYGFADRFSLFTRFTWAYVNQNSSIRGATGFGPGDQTAGLTYRVIGHTPLSDWEAIPFTLDLQVQGDFPVYSNANADANLTPYMGDGSIDSTLDVFAAFPIYTQGKHSIRTILSMGFTYRSANFSSAIPGSIIFEYLSDGPGVFASIGALGFASLKTDPNNGTTALLRSSIGSAGSFYTGGINPSLMQARAQIGYRFETDAEIYFAGQQVVWGQAVPFGLSLELGFATRLGGRRKNDPMLLTPKSYGQSNQGFINYSLDAHIVRTNDRLSLVKINKGRDDGIEVGQIFDIFRQKDGAIGESVARGKVTRVKSNEAALDITDYYKEVWIENGFIAKRLVQPEEIP